MSRDPLVYIEDILEACEKIQQYMEGVTRKALTVSQMIYRFKKKERSRSWT